MPELCASMRPSVSGDPSASRTCALSRSSSPSFPSSRRAMTAAAVNVFVIEPTRYCVFGVGATPVSASAMPTASSQTTLPAAVTAALTLGRRSSACRSRRSRESVSDGDTRPERARDRVHGGLDVLVRDAQIGREAQHAGAQARYENPLTRNAFLGLDDRDSQRLQLDGDEVRLGRLRVDGEPCNRQALCKPARPRMVLLQTLDVMVERVEGSSRDNPRLA